MPFDSFAFVAPDDNLGMGPVEIANAVATAASIVQLLGFGKDKKAPYKQWKEASDKVVSAYGPDFITGAQALGLDPGQVAQAISEYLQEQGIRLTPTQLINSQAKATGGAAGAAIAATITSNLPMIAIGGAALVAVMMMSKR